MNMFSPSEVVRAVAIKEISMQTLADCRELVAYSYDAETGKGLAGFLPDEILEFESDDLGIIVSVGLIMSRMSHVYRTDEHGFRGLLKITNMVDQREKESQTEEGFDSTIDYINS